VGSGSKAKWNLNEGVKFAEINFEVIGIDDEKYGIDSYTRWIEGKLHRFAEKEYWIEPTIIDYYGVEEGGSSPQKHLIEKIKLEQETSENKLSNGLVSLKGTCKKIEKQEKLAEEEIIPGILVICDWERITLEVATEEPKNEENPQNSNQKNAEKNSSKLLAAVILLLAVSLILFPFFLKKKKKQK
jgi:hypothetical protein